jgi:phosphatidylcholine synthase
VRALAFSVHIFTALGAGVGFLALIAAVAQQWPLMFGLLGVALIIDGIDGPLARKFDVAGQASRWSGEVLDLVVDFITYVFVPAYAIGSFLPVWLAFLLGPLIVVTAALYFADSQMKTAENYFRGFPAVWNLVAFYLLALQPEPWVCAVAIVLLAALQFAPVRFVHPMRVRFLRPVTIVLLGFWCVLAAMTIYEDLQPEFWVKVSLCVIGLYFFLFGLLPGRQSE